MCVSFYPSLLKLTSPNSEMFLEYTMNGHCMDIIRSFLLECAHIALSLASCLLILITRWCIYRQSNYRLHHTLHTRDSQKERLTESLKQNDFIRIPRSEYLITLKSLYSHFTHKSFNPVQSSNKPSVPTLLNASCISRQRSINRSCRR